MADSSKRSVRVVVEGYELPGRSCQPEADGAVHDSVHVAVRSTSKERPGLVVVPRSPWHAADPVPGDAESARWEVDITVRRTDDGLDFGGPFVRGDRTDRHIGLVWGDVREDGTFELFRGAKLRLADIGAELIERALREGRPLVARVRLSDAAGNPICARLRPPDFAWTVAGDGLPGEAPPDVMRKFCG
jgi:hypothetical protein